MHKQIEEMENIIYQNTEWDTMWEEIKQTAKALYNAGYRKQSENATDTNDGRKSEWISVDERLPENNLARVLVFLKDDEFTRPIGMNKIDTDRCIDGKWARWGKHVTHWMPLPQAPQMKGDKTDA